MKPPGNPRTQLSQPLERKLGPAVTELVPGGPSPAAQLSEDQISVLGCLRGAGGGLTIRQLQHQTACTAAEIRVALEGLLERHLAGRLNTLIPSYFSK